MDIHVFLEYSTDGVDWKVFKEPVFHRYKLLPNEKPGWVPPEAIVSKNKRSWKENVVDPDTGYWMVGRDRLWFSLISGAGHFWLHHKPKINGLDRARRMVKGQRTYDVNTSKGLPANLSPEVAKQTEGFADYYHNASWCTLPELLYWMDFHRSYNGGFFVWGDIRNTMKKLEEEGFETRLVYFFDS